MITNMKKQKQKVSVGEDVEYWNPCALLVGMQNDETSMENTMMVLQKIENRITI